jgi:pimeloyl-ACP methyl ester carboxylesterase
MIMPSVEVNGVKLNYIQIDNRKNGCGSDLVMIHGLATNMAFWYFQHAQEFADAYRVTLYDLRGHGRSGISNGGYTPRQMSQDLRQLLDHLGIARAHFIAHSFGGAVALNLACHDQERFESLILVDSHIAAMRRRMNGYRWKYSEKIQPFLRRYGIRLDVREPYFGYKLLNAAARLYKNNIEIDPEFENLLQPAIGSFSKRTAFQWLHLLESTKAGHELMGDDGLSLDRLSGLKFPIMAMYGAHSHAMVTGQQLLKVWPHAEFYKMRDAGHFFPVTRPKKFVECCRRFLEGSMYRVHRRRGDGDRRHFRSDRFYSYDGASWFVDTREELQVGPFESFDAAKAYLVSQMPLELYADTRIQPTASPYNRS